MHWKSLRRNADTRVLPRYWTLHLFFAEIFSWTQAKEAWWNGFLAAVLLSVSYVFDGQVRHILHNVVIRVTLVNLGLGGAWRWLQNHSSQVMRFLIIALFSIGITWCHYGSQTQGFIQHLVVP